MPAAPPLANLIAHVVERDEANQDSLKTMQYEQTLTTERLDASNHVTQKQEIQMIVRPGAPEEFQVVSERGDNLPTNPDQAALQEQGKKAQAAKFDFTLKDMVSRFKITLEGQDTIRGQAAFVIAFTPKPDQAYRNQTEKVLNHLTGRMWVRASDYTVLKTEATLSEPVEVAWIFADVSALTFHYELDDPSQGVGPAHIVTSVQVDAPLIAIRQRTAIELSQFEPRKKI